MEAHRQAGHRDYHKAKAKVGGDAAEAMRITAQSLNEFGLVDEVLAEPLGGAHRNPAQAAEVVRNALLKNLEELDQLSVDQLLEHRQRRLASFGQFKEA